MIRTRMFFIRFPRPGISADDQKPGISQTLPSFYWGEYGPG